MMPILGLLESLQSKLKLKGTTSQRFESMTALEPA